MDNQQHLNIIKSEQTLNMRFLFLFAFFLIGIQLSRYWNASEKSSDLLNYRYTNKVNSTLNILSTRVATSNRTLNRCNIRARGIVDIATLLIILSGDVNLNPGPRPPKYPCGVCTKAVKTHVKPFNVITVKHGSTHTVAE